MDISRATVLLLGILLALAAVGCTSAGARSPDTLRDMIGKDHFAGAHGMTDPALKAELNARIDEAAEALAALASSGASDAELLEHMGARLNAIDRDALDTEDAEVVASAFEAMLEPLGLRSSNGLLNTWMYGFDPS
jgi:hypothetical protein